MPQLSKQRRVAQLANEVVTPQQFGAKGDGTTDDSAAFIAAGAASLNVVVPNATYVLNTELGILDGQSWTFENATLKHTDDAKYILRANGKSDWSINGHVTLLGTRTIAATAAETGLYITGGKRYQVQGVIARNFKGKGIWLDGANPSGNRGDRGQFADCAAYDCTVGRQIDAGAEYTTWSNFNASGCVDGDVQAGGNVVTLGGNIVDNARGVVLTAGSNHLHGAHLGVNINHNTTFNIEATAVTNGHDFSGCHLYGNGSGSGAIFLNQCKGIVIDGGHLDCWIYNYEGGGSGLNYVRNMYCPGSYGDIERMNVSSAIPAQLIVMGCYGAGAYKSGVTINDPAPVYVHARRIASVTQSLTSATITTLLFNDEQVNGDRRGAHDPTTGVFTVPTGGAGQYQISVNVAFGGTGLDVLASYAEVMVNAGTPRMIPLSIYSTTLLTGTLTTDFYLNAGDTVQVRASITGTTPTFGHASYNSGLSIKRIA